MRILFNLWVWKVGRLIPSRRWRGMLAAKYVSSVQRDQPIPPLPMAGYH